MTDRRPLGTGPTRTTSEADTGLLPMPRAQLGAERFLTTPATTEPKPRPAVGCRMLWGQPHCTRTAIAPSAS